MIFPIFFQSEGFASTHYVQFKLLTLRKPKTHSWKHQEEVKKITFFHSKSQGQPFPNDINDNNLLTEYAKVKMEWAAYPFPQINVTFYHTIMSSTVLSIKTVITKHL